MHNPDPEYLLKQHLFVQIQNGEETLCHGAIPLKGAFEGKPDFEVTLMKDGFPAGILRGSITLLEK